MLLIQDPLLHISDRIFLLQEISKNGVVECRLFGRL